MIIILTSLIIKKQFTTLNLILLFLSGFIVILTILFEGKIKGKIIIPKQIIKLTLYGWLLVGLYVLVTVGAVFTTHHSIKESEKKAKNDSIDSANIISELKSKAITDSIEINNLKQISLINGLKSDSIKLAVVDNAVKALDEQRIATEKQNQNTYTQFKNEIEDNLEKIFEYYEKNRIQGFKDTLHIFTSIRLNSKYIEKYKDLSINDLIVDYLMDLIEDIDRVNFYADITIESDNLKSKATNINMFLANVNVLKFKLISVFSKTNNISNYKQYENLWIVDFNSKPLDELIVKNILTTKKQLKEGKLRIITSSNKF